MDRKNKPGIIGWLFGSLFLLLNILAVIWLGLCAAASIVSPLRFEYLALFSLTTPFAIAANLFFVFFWLFLSARKWRSLISVLAIIVCHKVCLTIFGFHFFESNNMVSNPGKTVKVISWNVHGMGIFNRPRNKEFEKNIIDFLKQQNADVLCFPEYYTPRNNILKPHSGHILKNNGYKEYRFNVDNDLGPESYLGTAIFSKYPIRNYEVHQLSKYIFMLQADILLPDSVTVRLFAVHLATFGLSDNEKAYIEEAKRKKKDIDSNIDRSKTIITKFTHAFAQRAEEAVKAAQIIKESPHPALICGDFNDLPGSYTYTVFRGNLNDAFLEKGKGFGRTYSQISPTLRIDYIFYNPSALRIVGYQCPATNLSDHYPVIANFEIIGKAAR